MSEYIFQGGYKSTVGETRVNLPLIHFQDEDGVDIIYSPHLDLTGYGLGPETAKESFEIVLEDFIDYTIKKKTLGKVPEGLSSYGFGLQYIRQHYHLVCVYCIYLCIYSLQHLSI